MALTVSLDPTVSTQAIRTALGLAPVISDRLAKPGRDVAYLDRQTIEHATGLDRRKVLEVLPEVTERLGLVAMVEPGRKHALVDGKQVGAASGWILVPPVEIDGPELGLLDLDEADVLLDPADARWGKGRHAAWRLAMVLVARHGITRVGPMTYAQAAEALGVSRKVGGLALASLRSALPVGEDLDLSIAREVAWSDNQRLLDVRTYAARKAWLDERLTARGDKQPEAPKTDQPVPSIAASDMATGADVLVLRDRLRKAYTRSAVEQ